MSNKVNSCSIPEGDIGGMCYVVGETESSTGCPKTKVIFELLDLIMGACLNPLCRTAHYGRISKGFKLAPIITAKSSDSESTFL